MTPERVVKGVVMVRRSFRRGFGALALACILGGTGCAEEPWLAAARHGSLGELKTAVDTQRQQRGFDRSALERLAQAVGEREIATASGHDGVAFLGHLGPCTEALSDALERRAQGRDGVAATAQSLLIRAGNSLAESEVSSLLTSREGSWRTVAALSARQPSLLGWRRTLMRDPDERVRRAAFEAAAAVPTAKDLDSLASAIRTDPDSECRRKAAHALGVLGGVRSVRRMSELFAQAEPELRLALVEAASEPRAASAGGSGWLARLVGRESGTVGVAAAAALVRVDPSRAALGRARLFAALQSGTEDEQLRAIAAASWSDPDHRGELLRLGKQGLGRVAVAALARCLDTDAPCADIRPRLRELAKEPNRQGTEARRVLTRLADASVVEPLRQQLDSPLALDRSVAASDLYRLRLFDAVAKALADDAPEVRLVTACLVLSKG